MGTGAACKDSHNHNTRCDQVELSRDTRRDPPWCYKQHRLTAPATPVPLKAYGAPPRLTTPTLLPKSSHTPDVSHPSECRLHANKKAATTHEQDRPYKDSHGTVKKASTLPRAQGSRMAPYLGCILSLLALLALLGLLVTRLALLLGLCRLAVASTTRQVRRLAGCNAQAPTYVASASAVTQDGGG
jgi:hypothetical protein